MLYVHAYKDKFPSVKQSHPGIGIGNPFFSAPYIINNEKLLAGYFSNLTNLNNSQLVLYYLQFLMNANTEQLNQVKMTYTLNTGRYRQIFKFKNFILDEKVDDQHSLIYDSIIKTKTAVDDKAREEIYSVILQNFLSIDKNYSEFLSNLLVLAMTDQISDELFSISLTLWIKETLKRELNPLEEFESLNLDLDYKRAIQLTSQLLQKEKEILNELHAKSKEQLASLKIEKNHYTLFYYQDHYQSSLCDSDINKIITRVTKNPELLRDKDNYEQLKAQAVASKTDYKFYVFSKAKYSAEYEWYKTETYSPGKAPEININHKNPLYQIEKKIDALQEQQEILDEKIALIDNEIKRCQDLLQDFFTYKKGLISKKLTILNTFKEYVGNIKLKLALPENKVNVRKELKEFNKGFAVMKQTLNKHRHPQLLRWLLGNKDTAPDSAKVFEEQSTKRITNR